MVNFIVSAILWFTVVYFYNILSYIEYTEIKKHLSSSFRNIKTRALKELLQVIACYISLLFCAAYAIFYWNIFSLVKLYIILALILYSIYRNYNFRWLNKLFDFTVYNKYREQKIKMFWGIGIACLVIGALSVWL